MGIQVTLSANSHPFAKVNFLSDNAGLKDTSAFQFTWIQPEAVLAASKIDRLVPAARTSLRMPKNAPAARKFAAPAYWETFLSCETVAKDDRLLQ